jgi:hypothetical protein
MGLAVPLLLLFLQAKPSVESRVLCCIGKCATEVETSFHQLIRRKGIIVVRVHREHKFQSHPLPIE